MARKNRADLINEREVNIYHITDRCVRRAFLMGRDKAAGQSFDYRRRWLRQRLVELAGLFRIDVVGFAIMGNHMHLLLRNRPDLVRAMSDEEAVRTWWEISPQYRRLGKKGRLTPKRLQKLLGSSDHVQRCRKRLSSISWFMRYLKHPLAIRANSDDDRSGHFWEARFRSKPIDSMEMLLDTMIYVDLNPIRAGLALSVPDSRYTSAYARIAAQQMRRRLRRRASRESGKQSKRVSERDRLLQLTDAWLSPIRLEESPGPGDGDTLAPGQADRQGEGSETESPRRPRASDLGVLPISTEKYLMLVDLVGRIEREGKRGKIPEHIAPILDELGLGTPEAWLDSYRQYSESLAATYARKVNTQAESELVWMPLVDRTKTNQDGFL